MIGIMWIIAQVKHFFSPHFVWPQRLPSSYPKDIPRAPKPSHYFVRRFWGLVHVRLAHFSLRYCKWYGIRFKNAYMELPFGLILKRIDRSRVEEAITMQVTRAAGLPVPLVICYGEHPDSPHALISILMTRLPGRQLGKVYEKLSEEEKNQVSQDLDTYLRVMRNWFSPWGHSICSVSGIAIRSKRVPHHTVGPFMSGIDFHKYLIWPAHKYEHCSEEEYQNALVRAKKMQNMRHAVRFTHGDLTHPNILVHNGHISGLLNWGGAGWYPEYWEFTTPLRYTSKEFFFYDFMMKLGTEKYLAELDCERALDRITYRSYR